MIMDFKAKEKIIDCDLGEDSDEIEDSGGALQTIIEEDQEDLET